MWLTGFDAPSLHTLYIDKPMRGHGLMQAIARVNRVYKGSTGIDQDVAVSLLLEKFEVVKAIFHGFDYKPFFGQDAQARVRIIPAAMEHVIKQQDGKNRLLGAVAAMSKAFALAVPHEKALAIQDEVSFFQAVRAAFIKHTTSGGDAKEELDAAVQQIVSKAVSSDHVVDIFSAAGPQRPELSVLSDQFLAEVRGMEHKNLAVELFQTVLKQLELFGEESI